MAFPKDLLKFSVYWILTYIFGVIYFFYFALCSLIGRYRTELDQEYSEREIQPKCLSDPMYGCHKFIKSQGVKLHYVDSGVKNLKLIVLIHGTPGFWFCWRKQIPILSQEFRVIAVDLRGCGDSECPTQREKFSRKALVKDIVAIISSIGFSSAHIICCETSGHLGWELAEKHPELVSKLILLNSPHPIVIHHLFHIKSHYYFKYWYLLFIQIPYLPEIVSSKDETITLVKSFLEPITKAKAISTEEADAYSYTFSRKDDWRGVLNHLRQVDLTPKSEKPQIEAITTPTLLLMGSSHPYFVTESAYRSAEHAERIKISIVDNAGCNMQVTHWKRVNDELLLFLRGPKNVVIPQPLTTKSPSFVGRVFDAVTSPYSMVRAKSEEIHRNSSEKILNILSPN